MTEEWFTNSSRSHRQAVALLGAALLAPFFVVDALAHAPPAAHAARAAWVGALLWGACAIRKGSRVPRAWIEAVMTATSLAATVVLVAVTGRSSSGYFDVLVALPFGITLLLPGRLGHTMVTAAVTTAAGASFLRQAGAAPVELARWTGTALAFAALAAYATATQRSLFARRVEAEQGRADLAEALAEQDRQLARTQHLAAVGKLSAGVAHEVNNPLAFLKANLAWLRAHLTACGALQASAEAAEVLDDAEAGVTRIARIVSDLSLVSHRRPAGRCRAPARAAVADACRVASLRTAGLDVRVAVAPDAPDAGICRGRLVQVLVNLLVNAADAIAEQPPEHARITVSAAAGGAGITFAVADSGPGFAPDALPRALDQFFTTKGPGRGTGLGLALAREYVTRSGGVILVANGPDGGACVTFELPAAGEQDQQHCLICEHQPAAAAQAPISLARRQA